MNSFDGKSLNSVTCHPSMHAPSLARVIDGKSVGIGRVGRELRGEDTARWMSRLTM